MKMAQSSSQTPNHQVRVRCRRSGILFTGALVSSLLWYLFWVTMEPVEEDIDILIDWFIFMKLSLKQVYSVYGVLQAVGYWCPLTVLVAYGLGKLLQGNTLPQVFYAVVIGYNTLIFVYLLFAGKKITSLFVVVLPLQTALALRHFWWTVLLLPTAGTLLYYISQRWFYSFNSTVGSSSRRGTSSCGKWWSGLPLSSKRLRFVFVVSLHLTAAVLVRWISHSGCLPCSSARLPPKPSLVAHRGCARMFPENTLGAFREASGFPQIVALETDVQISYDGVPFLLHDPHLVRTSDIATRCPSIDHYRNVTWLNYSSGSCPLREVNVGVMFQEDERVPTLAEFLEIAKQKKLNVIFDISEPPVDHPHHDTYGNKTLEAVVASGIDLRTVWWLLPKERLWVWNRHPAMVQVAKTAVTPPEEFAELHIQKVNDDWGTPLRQFRLYQAANLSLNMFILDSSFLFSYAWCIGVDTVTTNNCKKLSVFKHNTLYQACTELRQTIDRMLIPVTVTLAVCSLSCM